MEGEGGRGRDKSTREEGDDAAGRCFLIVIKASCVLSVMKLCS